MKGQNDRVTARSTFSILLFLFVSVIEPVAVTYGSESVVRRIEVNGQSREYRLFVPGGVMDKHPPAFLILHGGYSNASRMERYSGFTTFAASKGLVAVYPDGIDGHWNDGRINGQQSTADDLSFLRKLIQSLVAEGIDAKRVYVAGISNGGMMALHMACTMPDAIAGIAVVAASQPVDATCPSPRPLPVILFHGTADRIVPIGGGSVGGRGTHGAVKSHAETVSFWQKENDCGPTPTHSIVGQGSADGIHVSVEQFPCPPGKGLENVIIEGGGHTWPGAHQNFLLTNRLGPVTDAIDANQMMWTFLQSQAVAGSKGSTE